jgi:hypothetical protein
VTPEIHISPPSVKPRIFALGGDIDHGDGLNMRFMPQVPRKERLKKR